MTVKEFIANCPTEEFCAIKIMNMPYTPEFLFWMGQKEYESVHHGNDRFHWYEIIPSGITIDVILNSTIKTLYSTYDDGDNAIIGFEVVRNGV